MKYAFVVLLAVLAILLFLLWSPLRVKIEYKDKKVTFWLRCGFLKFKLVKRADKNSVEGDLTKTKSSTKPQSIKEKITDWQNAFDKYKPILDELFLFVQNKVRLRQIYLRLSYGTGDAASTGMIYGAIWALAGNVYAFLCRYIWVEFPQIDLEPVFDGKAFETEASGIIETRAVHIITATFRSLKVFLKHKKKKGAN